MSISSREHILGRVRAALGRDARNGAEAKAAALAAIARPSPGPRPPAPDDLVAAFVAASARMGTTLDRVSGRAGVPDAVARYLAAQALPAQGVAWPELGTLDWAGAGLDVAVRPATGTDRVGLTGCFCAIAETGTLLCHSSPETPAATSLLPETHLAVVPAGRIVAGMEEAWMLVRDELGRLPRALNFISGPSRTGDIEMTIVLGAHGPCRVHVILADE